MTFTGLPMSNIVSSDSLAWAIWPFLYCPPSCLSSVNWHILFWSIQTRYSNGKCLACYFLHCLYSENLLILFFFWIFFFSSPSYLLLTFPKILLIFKAHIRCFLLHETFWFLQTRCDLYDYVSLLRYNYIIYTCLI